MASGADPFHNFLSQITAFGEVNGLHLPGFLRNLGIAEVGSVTRAPIFEASNLCRFAICRGYARTGQLTDEFLFLVRRNKNSPPRSRCITPADHLTLMPLHKGKRGVCRHG